MEERITLITPNSRLEEVLLKYRPKYGISGCEGFVQPASLFINNNEILVQVKMFYKESYDDKGYSFSQDPNKKAEESYNTFKELKKKGFKIIPFFGLGNNKGENILIMTDLTEGNTIEVYDEKLLHRNRDVYEKLSNCSNWNDILLEFMRTGLLQTIHNIFLGFGVCNMITMDTKTNKADIFITDVGEFGKARYDGKLAEIISKEEFQLEQPNLIYSKILEDGVLAQELFEEYKERNPIKKEFMDLVYKAHVSLAFTDFFGGWIGDEEWVRKKFVKNKFNDKFMKIKLSLDKDIHSYKKIKGEELFYWDKHSKQIFMDAQNTYDKDGLLKGIDISYQVSIDNDLFYLYSVEEYGKLFQKPSVDIEKNLPKLKFLDDYFEKNDKVIIKTRCYNPYYKLWDNKKESEFEVEVELDWETGYYLAQRGRFSCFYENFMFEPNQVKQIYIDGIPIKNFDSSKIRIEQGGFHLPSIIYFYDEKPFHVSYAESEGEIKNIISKYK